MNVFLDAIPLDGMLFKIWSLFGPCGLPAVAYSCTREKRCVLAVALAALSVQDIHRSWMFWTLLTVLYTEVSFLCMCAFISPHP